MAIMYAINIILVQAVVFHSLPSQRRGASYVAFDNRRIIFLFFIQQEVPHPIAIGFTRITERSEVEEFHSSVEYMSSA
jgi:hypothetical protein